MKLLPHEVQDRLDHLRRQLELLTAQLNRLEASLEAGR